MSSDREWNGDNPYFLLFKADSEGGHRVVDLDRPGWLQDDGWIFRTPGELHLCEKGTKLVKLSVRLLEGEQGYYVARHIGIATGVGVIKNETIAYGIGKKRVDQNQDNLWLLSWGQICVGQDVEYFALEGLKKGLAEL